MTEPEHWAPRCVLCATHNRIRELDHGHVCRPCTVGLKADLMAIVEAAAIAAVLPDPFATRPGNGGARGKPGSRPPLDVAHIDPELVSVEAVKGDASSALPLLGLLEDWCRMVREDRGWVPYGVATEDAVVTLTGTCGWLRDQVDWMTETPDFDIATLTDHVRRGLGALRNLDPATERGGWRVPCPADAPSRAENAPQSGEEPEPLAELHRGNSTAQRAVCGFRLTVDPTNLNGDIRCPRCHSDWTPQRLLLLALEDERVVVWAHPDTITEALGIGASTLRRWGALGTVARRGTLYDVGAAHRARRA